MGCPWDLMQAPAEYALEGSIGVAGAGITWLRDKLGVLSSAAESEELAGSVASTEGAPPVLRRGLWLLHSNPDMPAVCIACSRLSSSQHASMIGGLLCHTLAGSGSGHCYGILD